MGFRLYLCACLASSLALWGCGSNESLGSGFPEDAGMGGMGGVASVTSITGAPDGAASTPGGTSAASAPVAGTSAAATTAVAGQTSPTVSSNASGGNTARAGATAAGGTSKNTSAGAGGTTGEGGKTTSGAATTKATSSGGSTTTGGSTSTSSDGSGGSASDGGTSGVVLTATLLDTEYIQATWTNNTQASIFLYGCGTVDLHRKDASGWTNLGTGVLCGWEGVSPEVKPGATYKEERRHGPVSKLSDGTGGIFRMSGRYGVGCTNPSAGQSKAGCTDFYVATSNEVTVTLSPVSPDAGVDAACGDMPEGVTCRKSTGGCAAMICSNGGWACAAGQTPVGLVPGACDVPDASAGG